MTRVQHIIRTKKTAEYLLIEVTTTNQLGVTKCVGKRGHQKHLRSENCGSTCDSVETSTTRSTRAFP
uniref:Uncharacterized protein n=1 Tax=Cucumis melo TaxID=3656 RepID=A0A9I9EI37_CUCME